ncbi:hypothetical protein EXIGLDRAFT_372315 [Exidia glandulosa HHB12029]|uniref:HIT-type domain-containing protein n=1 Tax=Exidia glandulosa HHB12029 TaxID=1314781 RepID=A0A165PWJ0_EXIGL|nr:hypothetical protein EXIGLDRAFT_372315 [Exidia glandulosa HHB12029]
MQRRQPSRQVQANAFVALAPDLIAKRTKRHLDELEASNYTEPSASTADDNDASGSTSSRARSSISDQRAAAAGVARKKKSTMAVRTALLYRKTLAGLIDESGIASYPAHVPTYLTASAPPPKHPPRLICSVCGYHGRYKCRKCALPYCDLRCEATHSETRCERRII